MKILITTDWYNTAINGVVTSVRNLEKGLTLLGHDVKILTLSQNKHSYQDANVTFIGSISAEKIYPNARIKIPMRKKLLKELINWKPDIIHSQCEFSTFLLAKFIAKSTGAPLIHTYHTIYEDYTHYFSHSKALGRKAVISFVRHIAKSADCFIAPTKKVYDILNSYGLKTPVEILPTGLDMDRIVSHSETEKQLELKESLGINPLNKIILYTGRLAKEKNLDEIIDYLGKSDIKNVTFLIIGDGPYRHNILNDINKAGIENITIMTGFVKPAKIKDYYAIGDVFVSASQSESQGLTYIEALANHVPLVCRKDDCLYNVLIDGYNGFTFTDRTEFTDAIKKVLFSNNCSMHENAYNLAKSKFSLPVFAENAEKIYMNIIKKQTLQ